MKKIILVFLVLAGFLFFSEGPLLAVKPGNDVNPNGFPAGAHYNLNIIGKKFGFVCPELAYYQLVTADNNLDGDLNQLVEECDPGDLCEPTDQPFYGNVIFIPEDGRGTKITIQSGTASEIQDLQVVDACGMDINGAVVQLPGNAAGYRVFARALAKPGTKDDPRRLSTTPQLNILKDDSGKQLFYLGELTEKGFQTSDGYIYRALGESKALEISRMFQWSGLICSDEEFEESTGGYQYCSLPGGSELHQPTFIEGDAACPDEYTLSDYYCTEYTEPTWVFNIAAFLEYMWSVDNEGMKLLQIRFYPITDTSSEEPPPEEPPSDEPPDELPS